MAALFKVTRHDKPTERKAVKAASIKELISGAKIKLKLTDENYKVLLLLLLISMSFLFYIDMFNFIFYFLSRKKILKLILISNDSIIIIINR